MSLQSLIDKNDNVEIVRDQIAALIVNEVANQQALAVIAGRDPLEWKVRVFSERASPWEVFPSKVQDVSPVINIWWDSATFELSGSNVMERQKCTAIYNIDVYGYGKSASNGSGHSAGDKESAFEAHRGLRLVRNILMASENTYLGLQGLVWRRFTNEVKTFQPQTDGQNVHQVTGARLSFGVMFSEFSPQYEPDELCYLSATVKRAEDGEIVVAADYDYTL